MFSLCLFMDSSSRDTCRSWFLSCCSRSFFASICLSSSALYSLCFLSFSASLALRVCPKDSILVGGSTSFSRLRGPASIYRRDSLSADTSRVSRRDPPPFSLLLPTGPHLASIASIASMVHSARDRSRSARFPAAPDLPVRLQVRISRRVFKILEGIKTKATPAGLE